MQKEKKGFITAAVLVFFSVYAFAAIILARSGMAGTALLYPGRFLYSYYLDSAFYVPLYLAACAVIVARTRFHYHNVILLILTLFPFVTAGTGLRLAFLGSGFGSFETGLLESFGVFAPVVVFLVALIEIMAIVKAGLYFSALRRSAGADGSEYQATGEEQDKAAVSEGGFPETGGESRGEGAQSWPDNTGFPYSESSDRNGDDSDSYSKAGENDSEKGSSSGNGFAPLRLSGFSGKGKADLGPDDRAKETPLAADSEMDEIYDEPAIYRLGLSAGTADNTGSTDFTVNAERASRKDLAAGRPEGVENRETVSGAGEESFSGSSDFPEDGDYVSEEEEIISSGRQIVMDGEPDAGMSAGSEPVFEEIQADEDEEAEDPDSTETDLLGEIGNGNQPEADEKPLVVKEYFAAQKKISVKKKEYSIPYDILDEYEETGFETIDARTREEAEILRKTLAEFRIEAEVTGIRKGPVITMFEILPAPGVKLSRISNLADNIALRLAASRVRIVAPIPGKHAVGIEVPNRDRAIVSFRELIAVDYPQYSKYHLPIVLGKDITGGEQIIDLTQTPHLLIAGATGSGKSVCVNSIIASLLYTKKPQDVRMILIDPKIVELKLYNDIPHLLTPVITDPRKAFQALQYCIYEMEKRYALLDALGVRDIHSFNRKIKSRNIATLPLPYIVVIVDEFADLMATTGKELESTLARLAAMSRAVGIHLVLATQRPSIDVITGLIKANIPSRIAFMVASKTDSRIIIDSVGAEMLLGRGDMLFTSAWNPYLTRIQGAYLSESEAERVVEKVREYGEPEYIDDEIFIDDEDDDGFSGYVDDYGEDPLMEKALEIVAAAGKASASYLQRRLKIGYNRAARLVEEMERRGIVGPQNGSKPRDILNIPGNPREQ